MGCNKKLVDRLFWKDLISGDESVDHDFTTYQHYMSKPKENWFDYIEILKSLINPICAIESE